MFVYDVMNDIYVLCHNEKTAYVSLRRIPLSLTTFNYFSHTAFICFKIFLKTNQILTKKPKNPPISPKIPIKTIPAVQILRDSPTTPPTTWYTRYPRRLRVAAVRTGGRGRSHADRVPFRARSASLGRARRSRGPAAAASGSFDVRALSGGIGEVRRVRGSGYGSCGVRIRSGVVGRSCGFRTRGLPAAIGLSSGRARGVRVCSGAVGSVAWRSMQLMSEA